MERRINFPATESFAQRTAFKAITIFFPTCNVSPHELKLQNLIFMKKSKASGKLNRFSVMYQ